MAPARPCRRSRRARVRWASGCGLVGRAHKNKVVVALAGKLARIAWAVLRSGEDYVAMARLSVMGTERSLQRSCRAISAVLVNRPAISPSSQRWALASAAHHHRCDRRTREGDGPLRE